MRALVAAKITVLIVFSGAVAAACALNAEGLNADGTPERPDTSTPQNDGGATTDASTATDASSDAEPPPDAPPPPPACKGDLSDCMDPVPGGWTRVGYAGDRSKACGEGFDQLDVLADPFAPPEACSCEGCAIIQPPNCSSGPFDTSFDFGSGTCGSDGLTLTANGCQGLTENFPAHVGTKAPEPQGGQCKLTGTPHEDKVQSTQARVCVPKDPTCEGALCASGGDFAECIWTSGNEECAAPFTTKSLVGTSTNLACGGCGCSVDAECTGTLTFYDGPNCMDSLLEVNVEDKCVEAPDGSMKSYEFKGLVKSAKCDATGSSSPTLMVKDLKTLCCK